MSTIPKSASDEAPGPPRNDAARDRRAFARRIDCDGGSRAGMSAAPARGGGMRDGGDGEQLRSARR